MTINAVNLLITYQNYIMDTSSFPPCIWASIPDQNCSRTNNGPESFHGHFNAQFYARHPNIFIDVLKQIQTSTYIKIRSLDTPALQRRIEIDKINFSVEKYQDYLSGTTSRLTYISSLGYKFSARTDMWMHQTFTFTSAKCI